MSMKSSRASEESTAECSASSLDPETMVSKLGPSVIDGGWKAVVLDDATALVLRAGPDMTSPFDFDMTPSGGRAYWLVNQRC